MSRTLLLLCCYLSALAQPLPLTWTDRPDGLVLGVFSSLRYNGTATACGPGEFLLAWCDARDGNGRVALQKVNSLAPGGPGLWHSQLGEWGDVGGLFLPPSTGSAYMPLVSRDGAGGALVAWQEVDDWEGSILRLTRVGDGPMGSGAVLWPEPVLVSEDVYAALGDCRDRESARCRSALDDPAKRICADGLGGLWVLWMTGTYELRLQHVDGSGALDPDFPTTGLALSPRSWNFDLQTDAAGRAVVLWQEMDGSWSGPLMVQGVGQDGQLVLPAGGLPLTLPTHEPITVRLAAVGGNHMLAAWGNLVPATGERTLRVQGLDEGLLPLFAAGGVDLGPADTYAPPMASCAGAGHPVYLTFSRNGTHMAQRLEASGEAAWGDGLALDIVGSQQEIWPAAMTSLEDGMACILVDNGSQQAVHLQRLDASGLPVWDASHTLLHAGSFSWMPASLLPDGDGGLMAAYCMLDEQDLRLCATHRDAEAIDFIPPSQQILAETLDGYLSSVQLLADSEPPLVLWSSYRQLFMQTVDRATGVPLLGAGGHALAVPLQDSEIAACPDGDGGAWVAGQRELVGIPSALELIRVHVAADGSILHAPAPVSPGLADLPGYSGVSHVVMAPGEGRVFIAYSVDTAVEELRVQSLDEEGNPLWGPAGQLIPSLMFGTYPKVLEPDGSGGFFLLASHFRTNPYGYNTYLQRIGADGTPLFSENEGRGLLVSETFTPYFDQALLEPLPGGGALLAYSERGHQGSVRLTRINETGARPWTTQLGSDFHYGLAMSPPLQGGVVLHFSSWVEPNQYSVMAMIDLDGQVQGQWQGPATTDWPDNAVVIDGENPLAVVSSSGYGGEEACALRGWAPGPDGTLNSAFCGAAGMANQGAFMNTLATDQAGGAWCAWNDRRTDPVGYGFQLRLLRLGELDNSVAPQDRPAAPAAFTLHQNRPNPFNPETWISFHLERSSPTRVEIFNLAGQRVRVLQDGSLPAGSHRLRFDARDDAGGELGSGLYFYRLNFAGQTRTARMLLVR